MYKLSFYTKLKFMYEIFQLVFFLALYMEMYKIVHNIFQITLSTEEYELYVCIQVQIKKLFFARP